jgi:uncharacterized membrane protein
MTALSLISGGADNVAYAINDAGQVVGSTNMLVGERHATNAAFANVQVGEVFHAKSSNTVL